MLLVFMSVIGFCTAKPRYGVVVHIKAGEIKIMSSKNKKLVSSVADAIAKAGIPVMAGTC